MTKKIYFILTLSLILFNINCRKAIPGKTFEDDIDTSDPPIQEPINEDKSFSISNKFGIFKITPIAKYSISALVVSRERYHSGWEASLSPTDLALVWGLLAKKKFQKKIKYSQRSRWYFFRYEPDYPLDGEYIISHSSNNHIIPASFNLRLALKEIEAGDRVKIEGFLVNVDSYSSKGHRYWRSSLRRDDTAGGSCELIYAKTIRINRKLFR